MRNYVDLHVCRTDGLLPNPDHPEEPIQTTTFWRWGETEEAVEEKRRQYEALLNSSLEEGQPQWIFTGGYIFGDLFPPAVEWPPVKYYFKMNLENIAFTFDTFIGGSFLGEADWFDQTMDLESPRHRWSHGR